MLIVWVFFQKCQIESWLYGMTDGKIVGITFIHLMKKNRSEHKKLYQIIVVMVSKNKHQSKSYNLYIYFFKRIPKTKKKISNIEYEKHIIKEPEIN